MISYKNNIILKINCGNFPNVLECLGVVEAVTINKINAIKECLTKHSFIQMERKKKSRYFMNPV